MRWQQFQFDAATGPGSPPGSRPDMAGLYRRVTGRSAWPASLALLTAGAVVVLPLLALLLLAVLVGGVVYAVASVIDRLMGGLGGGAINPSRSAMDSPPSPEEPGRENVRVMGRVS